MKNLFFIALILVSINSFGQLSINNLVNYQLNSVQMTATQTTTSLDPKFEVMQRSVVEAKRQIKQMQAQEAVSGSFKNKELTKQFLADISTLIKNYREKFLETKSYKWIGDSLQVVTEKARLTTEMARLKAEIANGEDSTYIQPQINQLQNRKNDLNKITRSWTRVK